MRVCGTFLKSLEVQRLAESGKGWLSWCFWAVLLLLGSLQSPGYAQQRQCRWLFCV